MRTEDTCSSRPLSARSVEVESDGREREANIDRPTNIAFYGCNQRRDKKMQGSAIHSLHSSLSVQFTFWEDAASERVNCQSNPFSFEQCAAENSLFVLGPTVHPNYYNWQLFLCIKSYLALGQRSSCRPPFFWTSPRNNTAVRLWWWWTRILMMRGYEDS